LKTEGYRLQFIINKNYTISSGLSKGVIILLLNFLMMKKQNFHLRLYHNFGKGLYECWMF